MPYAPAQDSSFLTRRGLVFGAIILLHVGMFWLLNSGLSHKLVDAVLGPVETRLIEEAPKVDEPPPPPPPKIETPPPFVPPPEVAIELPVETTPTTAIQQTTTQRPVVQPPPVAAPPAPVQRTPPKSDPRRPLSQPEYPPSSRRAGEAGTVILEVYVLENGRVGEARVKQSSGYPRLDEAAVREVKRSWRLMPGTEGGKPVPMWGQFAVTFKLTD
jgi:periplasmic protein TonB